MGTSFLLIFHFLSLSVYCFTNSFSFTYLPVRMSQAYGSLSLSLLILKHYFYWAAVVAQFVEQ